MYKNIIKKIKKKKNMKNVIIDINIKRVKIKTNTKSQYIYYKKISKIIRYTKFQYTIISFVSR